MKGEVMHNFALWFGFNKPVFTEGFQNWLLFIMEISLVEQSLWAISNEKIINIVFMVSAKKWLNMFLCGANTISNTNRVGKIYYV